MDDEKRKVLVDFLFSKGFSLHAGLNSQGRERLVSNVYSRRLFDKLNNLVLFIVDCRRIPILVYAHSRRGRTIRKLKRVGLVQEVCEVCDNEGLLVNVD